LIENQEIILSIVGITDKDKFCDELVEKSKNILKPIINKEKIDSITFVPSLRSDIVEDFAKRLANSCSIEFIQALEKKMLHNKKI
jgi:hypothetical protein